MKFTTSYRVQHASVIRNSGLLRVSPVSQDLAEGELLSVDGDPTRTVVFRTGRRTYDADNNLQPELIFVIEVPNFSLNRW